MELKVLLVTLHIIFSFAENVAYLFSKDNSEFPAYHKIPKEDRRYDIKNRREEKIENLKRKVTSLVKMTKVLDLINEYDTLGSNEDIFLENNKRQNIRINENNELKPCELKPIITSTYTLERGSQTPRHVQINRCQGGTKNPENHQCQPAGDQLVECFKTVNDENKIDFLGVYIHTKCAERCICQRKECKNKKTEKLLCPKGFKENKATCQCEITKGGSMFFRNMGMLTVWKPDLNSLCREYADDEHKYKRMKRNIQIGESFRLKKVGHHVYKIQ